MSEAAGKAIIVTGAHGFLGRHVARRAAASGYEVYGIGHGAWLKEEWQLWGLSQWHRADVTLEALREFAIRPEAIVHCAGSGSVGFSLSNPMQDLQRTVFTTAEILEFIRLESSLTKVVYPSSAGVYGAAKEIPIRETAATVPISPYGAHKLMAEQIIRSYARNFGVKAAIIRFFSIFGTGLRKQFLWDACGKLSRGDFRFDGTGEEVRDWLYVEDAASLVIAALDQANSDCVIVNGGTGVGTKVAELLSELAGCLGLDGMRPVFTNARRAGDPARYVAENSRAQSWGWSPEKDLKIRVSEYADWWLSEMGLPKGERSGRTAGQAAQRTRSY